MDSMQLVPDEVVLVKEEESAKGVVSFSVYRSYWAAVGHFLAPLIFCALFLMQGGWLLHDSGSFWLYESPGENWLVPNIDTCFIRELYESHWYLVG